MNHFPLQEFQKIIEFAIKNKLIKKNKINKIKDFFKELSKIPVKKLKEIEENDYIKDVISKEEFLQIYSVYINQNDPIIKELFIEIPYIDLEEIFDKIDIKDFLQINQKIKKLVEKNGVIVLPIKGSIYLVTAFPQEKIIYSEVRNLVGSYKLVLGYPYDVFKLSQKILDEIGKKVLESINFITSKDIFELISLNKSKEIAEIDINKEPIIEIPDIKINIDKIKETINVSGQKKANLHEILKKKNFYIIASPSTNDPKYIKAFISEGIQAIKLHFNITHPVSNQRMGSFDQEKEKIVSLIIDYPSVIWGIVPGNLVTDKDIFEEIEFSKLEAFFDFIDLFYHSYTPHYLGASLEKMVAIDKVLSSQELDILNKYKFFGIEASIIPKENYGLPLTLQDLMQYKKLIESTDIPVFIPTQKKLKPSDVFTLYEIGAKGIVLGQISTTFDLDTIKRTVNQFLEYVAKI